MKRIFQLLFLSFYLISQAQNLKIIQKPIDYSKERMKLSLDYMKEHHNLIQKTPNITPKIIVLHYTAGGTIESNFRYFNNLYLENHRATLKNQSPLNVSAHFLVDRDGVIYQLADPELFTRHTIGLNYCAIGIENIGSKSQPLTDKQVEANAELVRYLTKKYPIEYLIGHSEYRVFRNSKLWKETDSKYFTDKDDPGSEFMKKVREKLTDLKLKSQP